MTSEDLILDAGGAAGLALGFGVVSVAVRWRRTAGVACVFLGLTMGFVAAVLRFLGAGIAAAFRAGAAAAEARAPNCGVLTALPVPVR